MWLDGVTNGEGLLQVFGADGAPSIAQVELMEVKLDLATLFLRFNLEGYPSAPPEKWRRLRHNTAQVTLGLGPLRRLELRGCATAEPVGMALEGRDGRFLLSVAGTITIAAEAEFAFLPRISAYQDVRRPRP